MLKYTYHQSLMSYRNTLSLHRTSPLPESSTFCYSMHQHTSHQFPKLSSNTIITTLYMPILPKARPLLFHAPAYFPSISNALSKYTITPSYLPKLPRARPLLFHAKVYLSSISNVLSKHSITPSCLPKLLRALPLLYHAPTNFLSICNALSECSSRLLCTYL